MERVQRFPKEILLSIGQFDMRCVVENYRAMATHIVPEPNRFKQAPSVKIGETDIF